MNMSLTQLARAESRYFLQQSNVRRDRVDSELPDNGQLVRKGEKREEAVERAFRIATARQFDEFSAVPQPMRLCRSLFFFDGRPWRDDIGNGNGERHEN